MFNIYVLHLCTIINALQFIVILFIIYNPTILFPTFMSSIFGFTVLTWFTGLTGVTSFISLRE